MIQFSRQFFYWTLPASHTWTGHNPVMAFCMSLNASRDSALHLFKNADRTNKPFPCLRTK